jgi:hypothetical protein
MTERVSYHEIKNHLKNALIEADDPLLKSQIAYNLSVINYCEIQDHNDRIANSGGDMDDYVNSQQADEDIQKDMDMRQK